MGPILYSPMWTAAIAWPSSRLWFGRGSTWGARPTWACHPDQAVSGGALQRCALPLAAIEEELSRGELCCLPWRGERFGVLAQVLHAKGRKATTEWRRCSKDHRSWPGGGRSRLPLRAGREARPSPDACSRNLLRKPAGYAPGGEYSPVRHFLYKNRRALSIL